MRSQALTIAGAVAVIATIYLWADGATIQPGDLDRAPSGSASERAVLANAPAGLGRNGSYVRSDVDPDGTIHVTQWIRSRRGLEQVTLAPASTTLGDSPVATGVRLVDDRGGEHVPPSTVGASPWVVSFVPAVRAVRLTYDLTGTVARSDSVPGRALADPTALDVGDDLDSIGQRTIEVTGVEVLNLACGPTDATTLRPCGRPEDGGWIATLARAELDDRVVAQLDLDP